jgi:hypothetical protein
MAILMLILQLLIWGLDFGARADQTGQSGKINRLMAHEIDPDLVIFGASNAFVDFDPDIIQKETGLSVFNMGIDGTPFVQNQALIREFADYTKNCKYVVMAGSFISFKERAALKSPGKYYPHFHKPYVFNTFRKIDPDLSLKLRYVPFYKFVAYDEAFYKSVAKGYAQLAGMKVQDPERKGFLPKKEKWNKNLDQTFAEQEVETITFDPAILKDYRETLAELNEKGIKAFLLITPLQADGQTLFANLDALRDTFRSLAGTENVFIDYTTDEINRYKRYFYNYSHLNATGADTFSAMFARDLMDNLRSVDLGPSTENQP